MSKKKQPDFADMQRRIEEARPAIKKASEAMRKSLDVLKDGPLIFGSAGVLNSYAPVMPPRATPPAQSMQRRLPREIGEFEKTIDPDKEVGVQLIQSGTIAVIHIESVGFHGSDLVTFEGTEPAGSRVRIVKHFTQVDVIFKALPRINEPARRIGFLP